MMYPSMIISRMIIPFKKESIFYTISISSLTGLVLTAWDVAMEPMMISKGAWVWEKTGDYFGIPLLNFFLWWLATFVSITIFQIFSAVNEDSNKNSKNIYAVYSYTIISISTVIIDYLTGLEEAALAGFFAIIPWIIIAAILSFKNLQKASSDYGGRVN
jgi:putative membrane protein